MANRTVKVYGNVLSGPVNLTISINNVQVFSGSVAAAGNAIPAETQELASFDLDEAIGSPLAATFVVSGGDITVQRLEANHLTSLGPVLDDNGNATDVTITETSPEYTDFGGYSQGGWADKSSIMIDGESHGGTDNSYEGSWHIQVSDGETMTCNFSV